MRVVRVLLFKKRTFLLLAPSINLYASPLSLETSHYVQCATRTSVLCGSLFVRGVCCAGDTVTPGYGCCLIFFVLDLRGINVPLAP